MGAYPKGMKLTVVPAGFYVVVVMSVIGAMASGCAKREVAGPAPSAAPAPIAPGTPAAPREVVIGVADAMKFTPGRLEAVAGETIRIQLVNNGSAPKAAMGHNWVLLKKGADAADYINAAVRAQAEDYLPALRAEDVVAATKLLGGGERDAVTFVVPAEPGEYTYVCTFPGHFQLGMKGVLTVR